MNKFLSTIFCGIIDFTLSFAIILVALISFFYASVNGNIWYGIGIGVVGIILIALSFGFLSMFIEIYKLLEEIRDILKSKNSIERYR